MIADSCSTTLCSEGAKQTETVQEAGGMARLHPHGHVAAEVLAITTTDGDVEMAAEA